MMKLSQSANNAQTAYLTKYMPPPNTQASGLS